jgi:AcrR family transcriptional regulator
MPVSDDTVLDEILDAARSCVLEFGASRTTLSEVARRSGRSRPTIYSRWSDARAIVADVLTREMLDIIEQARPDDAADARAVLVDHVVAITAAVRADALFRKLVAVDQDMLATYVFQRLGSSQQASVRMLEGWVRKGQQDGSIRPGKPAVLARMVLLTAQSAIQSAQLVADRLSPKQLDRELRHLLDCYLKPRLPGR